MRISDIINEDISDMSIANIGGWDLTVGDIQKIVPDADPKAIIHNATKIKSLVDKYGDTALTAASLLPFVRYGMAARAGMPALAGAVGKSELIKVAGKEVGKNVEILPDKSSGEKPLSQPEDNKKKKRKYNVGDRVPVVVSNKTHSLPIKTILPTGYEVDASSVPGNKPGQTMTISEPL